MSDLTPDQYIRFLTTRRRIGSRLGIAVKGDRQHPGDIKSAGVFHNNVCHKPTIVSAYL